MDTREYGHFILRLVLGLLFFITGVGKLMAPSGAIGMLESLGFPAPSFFGWLLILVEVLGGLALIVGFKVKYATWPLAVVLAVAILTVHLKDDPITILFRVLGIAAAISLSLTGPGKFALSKA